MNPAHRFRSRTICLGLFLLTLGQLLGQTVKPELKNVKAAQRPDSYLVDITYDLIAPEGVEAVVIVEFSGDNGASYDIPAVSLTGDFMQVKPGLGKKIVWNAWNDWPGKQTAAARVRLTADGLVPPPTPAPTTNLVWIPPGTFTMGSPSTEVGRNGDEGPQTQVWISRGFWMGKYEVTQREYQQVMGSNPSRFQESDRLPVETVSWTEAVDYCARLTARERDAGRLPAGYVYRLPTEAEWEYACRAGTATRFSYGDDLTYGLLNGFAWSNVNSRGKTHTVGEKSPNRWGLFDMHGNVWEWCADWYDGYPGGALTDPKGPGSGSHHVFRGGSWVNEARASRSAFRDAGVLSRRDDHIGFRAVLAPGQ